MPPLHPRLSLCTLLLSLSLPPSLASETSQPAGPRPWQEFLSQGLNTGIGGMNKGLEVGLASAQGEPHTPAQISQEFSQLGTQSAQGFGNLASGVPAENKPAPGAAADAPDPATDPPAEAANPAPASTASEGNPGSVQPGTLEGMGGDKPFLDNSAFLPTTNKAHLGSEQEFLNAAALTGINFGNLAHKHANLHASGKGDGQVTAQEFSQEGVNTANRFILLSGPIGQAIEAAHNSPELQPSEVHREPMPLVMPSSPFIILQYGSLASTAAAVAFVSAAAVLIATFRNQFKSGTSLHKDLSTGQADGTARSRELV